VSSVTKVCGACQRPFELDTGNLSPRFAAVLLSAARNCVPCSQADRAAREEEDRQRDQQAAAMQAARWVRDSGLPDGLGVNLDDEQSEARHASRLWALGDGPAILVLAGDVGTGKTALAAAAFRHRLRKRAGYWRSIPVLLSQLSLGFGNAKHDQAVSLLDGSYMLGLDDLDKAGKSEYVAQHIFGAIDGCYATNTPLVVTTNLSIGDLAGKWPEPFGEAIVSRLTDRSKARVVRLEGDDRRLRSAA
jgi:DNA replication protein DnaC